MHEQIQHGGNVDREERGGRKRYQDRAHKCQMRWCVNSAAKHWPLKWYCWRGAGQLHWVSPHRQSHEWAICQPALSLSLWAWSHHQPTGS